MINWFNHMYPYGNLHELNLDWVIATVKRGEKDIADFIGINTIKYADPILWNIESQYEANTVVVDGQTGNAYISVKAVPSGVHLNRTEYWTQIYNYANVVNTLREQIAYNEGESTTATRAYIVDDLVFVNGVLCRVIAPMIGGDSFVIDSNVVHTTINAEIARLHGFITDEVSARENADTQLQTNINNEVLARENSDTQLQTNIDNEVLARENADTQLQTNIDNEVLARENADNDINERIDNLDLTMLLHPSGDTTGATDVLNINNAINDNNYVLLDKGDFYINSAILVQSGTTIIGVGNNLTKIHVTSDISAITPKTVTTSVDNLTIKNLHILGVEPTNSTHYALDFNYVYDNEHYYGARYSLFENIDIRYFYGGFRGSQFWNTTFIKCRFSSANTDVRLRDAVNNVSFIQCVFNPDKYTLENVGNVPVGVGVFADNGDRVECYNISFYNCDCEYRSIGYKLITAIACGFYNCYNESMDEVINFDSCSDSQVIGGNINGCNVIARVANSYSAYIYNGLVSFKNLFVKVNANDNDKAYIIPTNASGKVYVENINIHNTGTGKCYIVHGDQNTFRTGQANADSIIQSVDLGGIRYASQEYKSYINNWGVTKTLKLQGISVIVRKTFTTSTSTILQLLRGSNIVAQISIPAGTHTDGEILTGDVSSVRLINTNDFTFKLSTTVDVEMNLEGFIRGYIIEDGQNLIGEVPLVVI